MQLRGPQASGSALRWGTVFEGRGRCKRSQTERREGNFAAKSFGPGPTNRPVQAAHNSHDPSVRSVPSRDRRRCSIIWAAAKRLRCPLPCRFPVATVAVKGVRAGAVRGFPASIWGVHYPACQRSGVNRGRTIQGRAGACLGCDETCPPAVGGGIRRRSIYILLPWRSLVVLRYG